MKKDVNASTACTNASAEELDLRRYIALWRCGVPNDGVVRLVADLNNLLGPIYLESMVHKA